MEKVILPANEDFERFILGSILGDQYAQYQALHDLERDDFYYVQHQKIYECFEDINRSGRRVDLYNVSSWLKGDKSLVQVGGVNFITLLAQNYSNTDVDFYIGELKGLKARRKLIEIGSLMESKALTSKESTYDLVHDFQKKISEIGSHHKEGFTDIADVIQNYKDGKSFIDVIKDEVQRVKNGEDLFEGVRSYFPKVDRLIGGFENGTNNIIGARSSAGKTTLLANFFLNIHEKKPEVRMGFFSLEMKKTRILDKILCTLAGVSYKKLQDRLLSQIDIDNFERSQNLLDNMNLTIFDHSGININELRSVTRKECITNKLDIVFLDYLTLVQSSRATGSKHQEVDQISKGLQSIALELDIPFVTLAQLNRNVYGRTDKTPVMGDLRESGSIEEDADLIMLLHRPIHYALATENIEDITQLHVVKSRLVGDLGKIDFEFEKGRYKERDSIEEIMPNKVAHHNEPPEKGVIWNPVG